MKIEAGTVMAGDVEIAYRRAGKGKPLVLLHGNSGSSRMYGKLMRRLAPDRDLIAFDSRAHGRSGWDGKPLSYPALAADIARAMEALGLEGADMIGYSDGGILALVIAARRPGLLGRAVAVSPNYLASGTVPWFLKSARRAAALLRALGAKKAAARFALMLGDSGLSADDLRAVAAPLLVLGAEKDLVERAHMEGIVALVPGSRLEIVPGCTHLNIMGKEAALRRTLGFLAGSPLD